MPAEDAPASTTYALCGALRLGERVCGVCSVTVLIQTFPSTLVDKTRDIVIDHGWVLLPDREPSVANQKQQHPTLAACTLSFERRQQPRRTAPRENYVHG